VERCVTAVYVGHQRLLVKLGASVRAIMRTMLSVVSRDSRHKKLFW
jgi:hypothetical protein